MKRLAEALTGLLLLIASDSLAQNQAAPIAVGEVRGARLHDLALRFGAVRDPAPAISLVTSNGRMDIYPVQDLQGPDPDGQACDVRLLRPSWTRRITSLDVSDPWAGSYERTADIYLLVRNGVVAEVINPPFPKAMLGRGSDERARFAMVMLRGPADPYLSSEPGRLPLSDGEGFLARRPDLQAPTEGVLARLCGRSDPQDRSLRRSVSGSGLQDQMLQPFAWRSPEGQREAGKTAFALMRLGETVPNGVDAFVGHHGGLVQSYEDAADPGYRILTINMGPGEGVMAFRDTVGLVGIRDGVVVWLADGDGAYGLNLTASLCMDSRGRFSATRPKCLNSGYEGP